jgi:hypothetical protein
MVAQGGSSGFEVGMQEHKVAPLDLASDRFREALVAYISLHRQLGREQLLEMVFRAYEQAISDLILSGRVVVEKSSLNESHLDMFVWVDCQK